MDDTRAFVQKVQDEQQKAERNKSRGQGNEGRKLPGKQHGNNK